MRNSSPPRRSCQGAVCCALLALGLTSWTAAAAPPSGAPDEAPDGLGTLQEDDPADAEDAADAPPARAPSPAPSLAPSTAENPPRKPQRGDPADLDADANPKDRGSARAERPRTERGPSALQPAWLRRTPRGRAMTTSQIEKSIAPSVVSVVVETRGGRKRTGTGFVIDVDVVATSYDLVRESRIADVRSPGGGKLREVVGVIAVDEDLNIAVLKTRQLGNVAPVRFASQKLKTGERVYAVGTKEDSANQLDLSDGVVTGMETDRESVDVTAQVSSVHTGGPLVNEYGEVVGVVTGQDDRDDVAIVTSPARLFELLEGRHEAIGIGELEDYLDDRWDTGEGYDDGYDDDYDDDRDSPRERRRKNDRQRSAYAGSQNNDVLYIVAAFFLAPPIIAIVGVVAGFAGICCIYGCALFYAFSQFTVIGVTAMAGGTALAASAAVLSLVLGVVAVTSLAGAGPGSPAPILAGAGAGVALAAATAGAVVAATGASLLALSVYGMEEEGEGEADAKPEENAYSPATYSPTTPTTPTTSASPKRAVSY